MVSDADGDPQSPDLVDEGLHVPGTDFVLGEDYGFEGAETGDVVAHGYDEIVGEEVAAEVEVGDVFEVGEEILGDLVG